LPNPFAGFWEVVSGPYSRGFMGDYRAVYFLFLSGWALLLVFLSLHWLTRQLRAFRPPSRKKKPVQLPLPREEKEKAKETAVVVAPVEAG
jgi:hypothetical protein